MAKIKKQKGYITHKSKKYRKLIGNKNKNKKSKIDYNIIISWLDDFFPKKFFYFFDEILKVIHP